MKASSLLLCLALSTTACLSADAPDDIATSDDPAAATEATQAVIGHPGVDWYYTCSDDLLVCRAGYGAVEWLHVDACGSQWRIKCQFGAQNP
jgi:hypothetical protein